MSKTDMMHKRCKLCDKGHYVETSLWDDWDGRLHCSKCNHETKRHVEESK